MGEERASLPYCGRWFVRPAGGGAGMLAGACVAAAGESDARGCLRGGLAAGEQERLLAAASLLSGKEPRGSAEGESNSSL